MNAGALQMIVPWFIALCVAVAVVLFVFALRRGRGHRATRGPASAEVAPFVWPNPYAEANRACPDPNKLFMHGGWGHVPGEAFMPGVPIHDDHHR